jgi:hypothetical protein
MKYSDDKIQQQIEAYLNQDMSDLERSRFEKQIHDDQELHDEVEIQQATIEAIRNERILALKAGLSSVNVSLWSLSLIEGAKIAAIVAGIGLASIGGYIWYDSVNQKSKDPIQVGSKPDKTIIKSESTSSNLNPEEPALANREVELFNPKPQNSESPDLPGKVKTSSSDNKIAVKGNVPAINEMEITEPASKQIATPASKEISLQDDGISNKSVLESVHPELVIKKDNKDKFHYQFSDSKLVLYADFGDKIYEVLELNQEGNKQLFFSYDEKFYTLDAGQTEIVPLKEVSDRNLIQTLKAYQKRKN